MKGAPANKAIVEGRLQFTTAMRIGGPTGQYSTTDSSVLLTPDGQPYVPGSSLKGVFRSTVERIVAGFGGGVWTCLLEDERCPGTQGRAERELRKRRDERGLSDAELAAEAWSRLCDTCKLFGSPFFASKVFFDDLYLAPGEYGVVERRDGVAIDRDSGRAADRRKFDFEVTGPGQQFRWRMMLEDATDLDRALVAIGLSEFMSGTVRMGGYTSRGLGACLLQDVSVYAVDFSSPDPVERLQALRKYLTHRTLEEKMERLEPVGEVFERWLEPLWTVPMAADKGVGRDA